MQSFCILLHLSTNSFKGTRTPLPSLWHCHWYFGPQLGIQHQLRIRKYENQSKIIESQELSRASLQTKLSQLATLFEHLDSIESPTYVTKNSHPMLWDSPQWLHRRCIGSSQPLTQEKRAKTNKNCLKRKGAVKTSYHKPFRDIQSFTLLKDLRS